MSDADEIRVSPENQRAAGNVHGEVADFLRSIPTNHDDIIAWAQSLGPIYRSVVPEIQRLLNERHADYTEQAQEHEALRTGLHANADAWEAHEQAAAAHITKSTQR
jgi:hypothetical protein